MLSAVISFIIFLHPRTRNKINWIAFASVLVVVGIFLKRMFLMMAEISISPLGDLVMYYPTILEINVMVGFWIMAMLVFTLLIRMYDMEPLVVEH